MGSPKKWFVFKYEHIDYLDNIRPIEKDRNEEFLEELKQLFKNEGWEGDGEIGEIWLPPFLLSSANSVGHWVYHVKQQNNGTSFIASSLYLPFPELLNQNVSKYLKSKPDDTNEPVNVEGRNIIQYEVDDFKKDLHSYKDNIEKELRAINEISNQKIKEEIEEKILGYNQCMIIQLLQNFMDDCYLQLLIEVLENGNKSKLKLAKKNIKLDFNKHVYKDMDGDDWLTITNIISDVWDDFKRTGFTDKLSRLTKPLDYEMSKQDKELRHEIIKHVIIRNCIQHHNWQLDRDSLNFSLPNTDSIEVMSDENSTIKINMSKRIKLSKTELYEIIDKLNLFAETLSSRVGEKVKTRY
ncbi:hypothetical protein SIA70_20075 [Bacillus subtilis]|uniref:Uncharacterized protein n=1 Tax=Bacillus subtilis subsp. natto TaxID=86029 RepID=E9RJD9_BACNA|nr:hypothetical protein [Bacillus subtilis]MDX6158390.1 hypothetical protein [Bacillus subtilis]OAZ70536.1 hypothetical protein SRCM101280_01176 [Bacillus subtilis]QAW48208.1 hypothetical protein ETK71_21655 [Bacillus subtilis]BAJ77034.1 hypothetical protein [Bacillus subtilis subsp. natto]